MNTAETVTVAVCVTVLALGAGTYALGRHAVSEAREAARDALATWSAALREGWVKGSASFGTVAPGKRFETPAAKEQQAPETPAGVAADDPAPATPAGQTGPRKVA